MMVHSRIGSLVSLFSILFAIDRVSKLWALHHLAHNVITLLPFAHLELVINKGISWGLLNYDAGWMYHAITLMIAIIIIGLTVSVVKRYIYHPVWPEVLVLAGAVSNLIDRLYYHGVIDFISLSYNSWSFPVFNIADCYIVVGVLIMAYYSLVNAHE